MSRARLVCSEILSRMSPVNHFDDKVYSTSQDKIFNLCFNECSNGENTDVSSVLSELNTSMDDWLPQKTCMDTMDSTYLNDINFLSTRDPDMCTSDVGLELILVNNEKKESHSHLNYDKNADLDYSDPLLNLVPMNEVLLRKTDTKCDNLLGGKDLFTSEGDGNKNKPVWDTLSINSRKSDCDVENNSDFADFNLLSLSFDANENETEDDQVETLSTLTNEKPCIPDATATITATTNEQTITSAESPPSSPILKTKKLAQNKRPNILRPAKSKQSSETATTDTQLETNDNEQINQYMLDFSNSSNKGNLLTVQRKQNINQMLLSDITGSVAVVSNAVGKTRVEFHTSRGLQQYEGNTSDVTEGIGRSRRPNTPVEGEHIVTQVHTAAAVAQSTITPSKEPEDCIVKDMLAMLGITDDMLYSIVTNLGMRMWLCPEHECRRIFNRLSTLKSHILSHYGLKPFKCDFPNCPWSFYTSFKLKRHRETHLKRKDFTCTVADCNRSFTTVYNLNTHMKLHERPARLKCLVRSCSLRFQTRRAMEMHLKSHELALAPYRCSAAGCSKPYFSLGALTAHQRAHQHKEEELRCQWENCGRLFDKPCRLRAHMRTHTGDKPYVCRFQDCHWAFASSSKLKRHQYKHNNERRFRCTIGDCTKAFMRSEHLREHTYTHIAQRTFQCPICGEKCSAKATLYVHKKKFHSTPPTDTKIDNDVTTILVPTTSFTHTQPVPKPKAVKKTKISKSCARTYMPYVEKISTSKVTAIMLNKSEDVLLSVGSATPVPDSEQAVYLSNMMLQDPSETSVAVTEDVYTANEEAEFILLFDSTADTTFPGSTVNLKDLD